MTLIYLTQRPTWAMSAIEVLTKHPNLTVIEDAQQADIVLHFGHYDETLWQKHRNANLGFWFFRFAGQDIPVKQAAKRAVGAEVALESSLWVKQANGDILCLYQSFGQNDGFATWRNVARTLAKAAYYPERVLTHYQKTNQLPVIFPEQLAVSDSIFQSVCLEATAVFKKIIHKLFYHEQWFIVAGQSQALLPDPKTATWQLIPPNDCFWADPFPVEKDGRVWIFLEALPFATNRGHLAAVELYADGTHSAAQNIMLKDYHLSYPFLLHWQNELYLLPEAGESREVALWRCIDFPHQWEKAATLLSDVCFTDATLIEHKGLWWLFLTIGELNGICLNDELHIYYADNPFGTWTAHAQNPVKSDARNARPAGNLFHRDGVLYRPAQDCGTGYGKAVVLNRIDNLTPEHFAETPIDRINSNWREDNRCTHTLSRSEHYWAIDGLRLIPRWQKT